ncbi:DNA polymerase III subunit delta' [Aestuariivita sp.]|jgi:DNA polymerase-3 subunit delta'|uniref:DNA polymerase III subunit delta' n=1 Tax=Aestuariivita sp. TaxID=1872407 RepID=UPI00216E4CE1|nr:DNA polymerase III subunit delta' [Aestuariivita sp.]MCE8007475.1 DNA polymerase III subunit delta' [Aestuariivita sp.]
MSPSDTDGPRPDQTPGAPHPRETARLLGQAAAEVEFLQAFNSGRMHHGWMLTGPRGVGKATLAYRIARFLLATPPVDDDGLFGAPPPPGTLEIDPEHPVARHILAGAEPGLKTVTRSLTDTGKLSDMIRATDIRALNSFFGLSATEGGRRVVIVDAADEMNTQAANALLKMLEEPPRDAVLLLIVHQPARLLPTIRSRCRTLRLSALSPVDMAQALQEAGSPAVEGTAAQALAELSGGSVGTALRLLVLDGLSLYADLITLLATLPRFDRARARSLADSVAGARNAERLALLFDLLDLALTRLARTGATGQPLPEAAPGEVDTFARLAPDARSARAWADTAAHISARARHGLAVNLDPAALVLDTIFSIAKTAQPASS